MIEIFLAAIALIWLVFASISDIKTHEVPDWLSYSLIIIGFGNALFNSIILNNIKFLFYSIFAFTLFFLVSALMYYTKQWGGGDVKLLIGIATLFPVYPVELLNYFNPNLNLPFILILILNLIVFGALYSIVYSIYLLLKNKINFIRELRYYKFNKIYLFIPLIFIIISILIQDILFKLMLLSLGVIILVTPLILIYTKIIEKKCMFKKISLNKLTEGDWIKNSIYHNKKLIYNKNSPGVAKEQISIIKKLRIRYLIIKEGIPFIPAFLLSFVFSIIFGNIFPF